LGKLKEKLKGIDELIKKRGCSPSI